MMIKKSNFLIVLKKTMNCVFLIDLMYALKSLDERGAETERCRHGPEAPLPA
jgi:hypothetical protein